MAYLPGVHSAQNQITGPGTAKTDQTTPVDITADLPGIPGTSNPIFGAPGTAPLNVIRTITWADEQAEYTNNFKGQTDRINNLSKFGMFVIPCFSCHQEKARDAGHVGWLMASGTWRTRLATFVNAIKDSISVIEIGNEPQSPGDWTTGGTGPYLNLLDDAIGVIRGIDPSIEIITAGVPTGTSVNFAASLHANGTIFSRTDGFSLHPYYQDPGPLTYTGGNARYQIDWVAKIRAILDGYGANGAAQDMWITEFGWHTQNPTDTPNIYAVEGHGVDQQATKLQTAYESFSDNASALSIRAACCFSFQDYTDLYTWDRTCGMFRNRKKTGFNATAPVTWKDGILQTLGAMSAPPPLNDPPFVRTLNATAVKPFSATLTGQVNPKGSATTYHFEYREVTVAKNTLFLQTSSTLGGVGTVSGPGITAPPNSSIKMKPGDSLTLTETTSDTFDGWVVDGTSMGTGTTLPITMGSSDIHVQAGFTGTAGPSHWSLTVAESGPGSVQVRQQPGGVLVGTATNGGPPLTLNNILDGTQFTLDYIPATSTLTAWSSIPSGAVTGTADPLNITLTQNLVVTANATSTGPVTHPVDVTLSATGSGTVHVGTVDTSNTFIPGIDTDIFNGGAQTGDTHDDVVDGNTERLRATFPAGHTFNGWTVNGTPSTANPLVIPNITAAKTVTASVTGPVLPPPADLFVNNGGSNVAGGNGTTNSTNPTDPNRAFVRVTDAIAAVTANKTIELAAGTTYNEHITVTKNNFTLRGAAVGTRPIITRAGANDNQGIGFQGNNTNVTLDHLEIFDIQNNGGSAGGVLILNGCNNITLNDLKIHKIKGLAGGTPSGGGILMFSSGPPFNTTSCTRNITVTNCEIYEVGAGSVDGGNEHMGIFMAAYNCLVQGNSIYLCKKEAIRDYYGLRNTFKDNHFFLNWSGGAANYGNGGKWYNNVSYFNQIGFEPKHTNYFLAGGAAGHQDWGASETASAANNRTIFAHNTCFGNIGSDFDLGQGGDLFDYVTVEDNLFASRGTVNLRDFTPIGSHILVDHNNYNTPAGSPPTAPKALYARNFPGTANQDSSPSFAGYAGTYETNGTTTSVSFSGSTAAGDFAYTGSITGTDLGDGYGTRVGAQNSLGSATKTWTEHSFTPTTNMGTSAGTNIGMLNDGAYDTAWQAANNLGWLTFNFGSQKTVSTMVVDTIIRQNGPGQYKGYNIQLSNDNFVSDIRTVRTGAIEDDLRTSTKHTWTPALAQYVRLNITSMWQGSGDLAEISQVRLGQLT